MINLQRNKIVPSRRIKLTLVSVVLVSVLAGTIVALQNLQTETPSTQEDELSAPEYVQESQNHFSVIYRGYLPGYNDSYPDYYICVNDLVGGLIETDIRIMIRNQEAYPYWFKVDAFEPPPPGWQISQKLGVVGIDQTKQFLIKLNRTNPIPITEGRVTESINLAVKAYFYQNYTGFYDQDNFAVNFHFIDRTATVWSVLYYDNFDDGTNQGWSGFGVGSNYYRSYPYSFAKGTGMARKYFDIPSIYTEAYLILPMRLTSPFHEPSVYFNQTLYFMPDKYDVPINEWYQLTVPLEIGKVTQVSVDGFQCIDDVYVIAK